MRQSLSLLLITGLLLIEYFLLKLQILEYDLTVGLGHVTCDQQLVQDEVRLHQ